MRIVDPGYTIEAFPEHPLEAIERAGRTCYKSEHQICAGSASGFVSRLMASGHHSVIEHVTATVRFIVDRGVSHELVRHRLCSFSQESTRFCSYDKERFGREVTFIRPCFWVGAPGLFELWRSAMVAAEVSYFALLDAGAKPQEARSVLPNSLKTEIVVTANFREWLTIFSQRTSPKAHPQMREVMLPLQGVFARRCREVFGLVTEETNDG